MHFAAPPSDIMSSTLGGYAGGDERCDREDTLEMMMSFTDDVNIADVADVGSQASTVKADIPSAASAEVVTLSESTAPGGEMDVVAEFIECVKKVGGVQQYLQHELETETAKANFLAYLDTMLPESPSMAYTVSHPIPHTTDGQEHMSLPHALKLKYIAFHSGASLQPAPEVSGSKKLLHRVITEGFITSSEPLLITTTKLGVTEGPIVPFSLHCVKGMCRALTMMAYILWCQHNRSDRIDAHVLATCNVIYARNLKFSDAGSEIIYAYKLAHRATVRRAPHLLAWVHTLKKLQTHTSVTPTEMIRRWNATAVKEEKLTGQKQVVLKQVLSMPPSVLAPIADCVSQLGWENSWCSNDNLSSKKWMVGATFKSQRCPPSSPWATWGLVTQKCLALAANNLWSRTLHQSGKAKPTKQMVESILEACTLALHLFEESARNHSSLQPYLESDFLDKVSKADPTIEIELQTAIAQKDDNYTVRDNPTVACILNSHASLLGITPRCDDASLSHDADALDDAAFALLMQQTAYEQKTVRVWYSKMRAHEAAFHHQAAAWKNTIFKQNSEFACEHLKKKTIVHSFPETHPGAFAMTKYKDLTKRLMQQLKITANELVTIAVVNWTAPSLIPSHVQSAQIALMGSILAENASSNVCLALMPTHSYKGYKLYEADYALCKACATIGHINVDQGFQLLFSGRQDERDSRPMMYPGRVLTLEGHGIPSCWKKSKLMTEGRTDPCEMIKPKEMDVVDFIVDDSIGSIPKPDSSRADHRIPFPVGAKKFAQIGEVAWHAILDSLFDKSTLPSRCQVLLVDLSILWGQCMKAFTAQNCKCDFYMGFHVAPEYPDWVNLMIEEHVATLLQNQTLTLPNYIWKSLSPPIEHLETPPPRPVLKTLVWNCSATDQGENYDFKQHVPELAAADTKRWAHHPKHGQAFRQCMDDHTQEFKPISGDNKRKTMSPEYQMSKKPKIDASRIIEIADAAGKTEYGAETKSIELIGLKTVDGSATLTLSLRSNNAKVLINSSELPIKVSSGDLCVGFGKIDFRQLGEGQPEYNELTDIKFAVTSDDDLCFVDNIFGQLGAHMKKWATQKNKPYENCRIAYHTLQPNAEGGLGAFTATAIHTICAGYQESASDDQQSAGACLPPGEWLTDVTEILWMFKSTVNGFQPVRPVVVFMGDFEVPSKSMFLLGGKP